LSHVDGPSVRTSSAWTFRPELMYSNFAARSGLARTYTQCTNPSSNGTVVACNCKNFANKNQRTHTELGRTRNRNNVNETSSYFVLILVHKTLTIIFKHLTPRYDVCGDFSWAEQKIANNYVQEYGYRSGNIFSPRTIKTNYLKD
jgi:hypothetical protein